MCLTPQIVASNLERFYVSLLRTTIHNHSYHRPGYRPLQPIMYAFLDAPQSKHKRNNSCALSPKSASDDLHHHSILIVKPEIVAKFDKLCSHSLLREQVRRLDPNAHIKTFHICRIDPEPDSIGKVVDYASYWARTHRHTVDETNIILPDAEKEWSQKRELVFR